MKLSIVKRYLGGEGSTISLAKEINTKKTVVSNWIKKYLAFGESASNPSITNAAYTKGFKEQVVLDYLNGGESYEDLAIKYHISSASPIKNWVKLYNSHRELKDYIPGGENIYMAKSRKVNKEERIEIVKYCLEHDMDYKTTAKVFETTYANVFNWVKKYKEKGEEGLGDKRGRHKPDEEVDEVTLLKRQLKQKEHELEMAQLELRLLKKLDEIERRRSIEQVNMKQNMKPSKKLVKKG
ncbi:helix-turn-helix domain-containing protein [Beduini massiliensis]|uniref:helix-turn-helix domain-containing protein n=1 Tax=Beduini massiliensis TaxID=1585974 RepID=UPI000B0D7DD4|nr:helix-turn-helix domain-containing protein [Beduini massiliensis]